MKIKVCLLSLVALLSVSVYALDLPTEAVKQAMHSNEQRPFNGVVLIAQDNKTLYEAAYGNYGSPKLADQFVVASISKQITATLILQLVDQGLINLASPINKYLPNLSDSWATQVTVAQLLNHTSGITAIGQPLAFAAGTQFKYSPTITYYLLSQIAQNVTGKTYKELLAKLFKQAGMSNSHIATSRMLEKLYKNNPLLVRGFQEIDHKITPAVSLDDGMDVDYGWLHPGGGVITTAADLLNWNQALHVHKSLLSKESYNRMITASSARQHPRYGNIEYGFGVQLLNQDGLHEISHSGYINGYISTLIYYPQSKISLIVLENIAWDVTDVKRVFASHDSLRDLVRVTIQQEIAQNLNQQIQTKSLSLTDKTRNRSIPVELYKGSNIVNAKNKTTKRPLVIINHGHNIANSEYKFIAKDLVKRGYVVASIQHQLPNDPTKTLRASFWRVG